eukprot:1155839-Pelagomonas_calceolata.AAC.28
MEGNCGPYIYLAVATKSQMQSSIEAFLFPNALLRLKWSGLVTGISLHFSQAALIGIAVRPSPIL